ncbi:MAG: DNA methyltransferase [Bacteroidales bacterium]|nr:DNA methyltransferase [Bacteroidales bacterium]
MDFKEYIKTIDQLYHVGNTTEHSFRGALASYLQSLLPHFVVTNEPRRIECGAPDYVITQKDIPVAFLEAKDINDGDLDGMRQHKEQFNRYKTSLDRIIFTDYMDFHLYVGGEFQDAVRIAETHGDHVVGIAENEAMFNEMVLSLATMGRQRITSSAALAKQMAAKAHLLADAVKKSLEIDGEDGNSDMAAQLRAFRNVLIHDLTAPEFADIYAQTIVYGLFTARLYDTTPGDFSRQEAAELIPKSNPFLRKIFQSVAVYDLDQSIAWIVDDLVSMFAATDAEKIMRNYGGNGRHSDPIVHFYEDFLAAYDSRLRKARGVWYTPAPVVKFIVTAVDEILQTHFGLPQGLADDSTILIQRAVQQSSDKRTSDGMKHETVPVHRVQILDPATGTGTFLAEVIQQIRDKFDGMEGVWPSYVEKGLIPRLHGFEILMASYTIAHLKLSLTLKATGYAEQMKGRLNIFLTNSLEEATPWASNLFAQWLADEAYQASRIKSETPVMICIGNPPYSVSSQNNGKWITDLVGDYKRDLDERNIQPLSDDYIKFIRLGQYYIHKNGEGILAFISNNSFLDGIIHRQMRKSLLEEFDNIYILNLHGNTRRKETAPNGNVDENVFDIMQGVSINLFVKTGEKAKNKPGSVYYQDLYGARGDKYEHLSQTPFLAEDWNELAVTEPYYFFVPKDFSAEAEYNKGVPLNKIFKLYNSGIKTQNDKASISLSKPESDVLYHDFQHLTEPELAQKYGFKDARDWKIGLAKKDLMSNPILTNTICYRPFDFRNVLYTGKIKGVMGYPRYETMKHMLKDNVGLVVASKNRQVSTFYYFASKFITDIHTLDFDDSESLLPLFVYTDDGERLSNFDDAIYDRYQQIVGNLTPQLLFDYIYAVILCPTYRKTYKEFLKIDFPRIPYPKDAEQFHRLAEKGSQLRILHLMENAGNWKTGISFPVNGTNVIEAPSFKDGRVYINRDQFFGNVSELAWRYYVGGHQPAQKWLKDRRGRQLDYKDIIHYGRIIYALEETDRLMHEIDDVIDM